MLQLYCQLIEYERLLIELQLLQEYFHAHVPIIQNEKSLGLHHLAKNFVKEPPIEVLCINFNAKLKYSKTLPLQVRILPSSLLKQY